MSSPHVVSYFQLGSYLSFCITLQIRIRSLELHDPDHTDASLHSALLSNPEFLRHSAASMHSLVDVPLGDPPGSTWRPTDFTNLSQVWRGSVGGQGLTLLYILMATNICYAVKYRA